MEVESGREDETLPRTRVRRGTIGSMTEDVRKERFKGVGDDAGSVACK